MKDKELARWLHEEYEKISQEVNWKTQKKCQVDFEDLPENNKQVMIKLARRILECFPSRF